ncbi:hypothetical protein ACGFNF_28235 [Micromonospora sp. NPDC048868]|uniref:hypothetical protein n=1 Tax=Micromonospora sp. NPDC048868 TaxID=3364258 RepID=UPI003716E80E
MAVPEVFLVREARLAPDRRSAGCWSAAVLAGAIGAAHGAGTAIAVMTAWLALTPAILLMGPLRRRRDLPVAPKRP